MYQGIIIKPAPSDQPRDIDATSKYMLDLAHEGAKISHDDEGPMSGALNCAGDTRKDQLHELECQLRLHGDPRSSQAVSHQIMSYPDGCRPTRKQIERDLQVLLKKYGMEKHPLVWDAHGNTNNFHVHFLLSRISQFPDKNGGYPIADNGLIKKTSKESRKRGNAKIRVRTDWAACRQCAVAELNDLYGWGTQRNVRYTSDGTPIPRQAPKDAHSDKTRKGERKSGKKSKERQLSEIGRKVFRTAKSWQECDQVFACLSIEITFKTEATKIVGGYLTAPDGRKCAFSKCGPSCSYLDLAKRFGTPTPNDAANQDRCYLKPFQYKDHITHEEAKKRLLLIFKDAENWPTLFADIQAIGMHLERSGGGLIVKFNDGNDAIKCSEISNKYSLFKLEKTFGPCPLSKSSPSKRMALEQLVKDAEAILSRQIAQRHGLSWIIPALARDGIYIIKKPIPAGTSMNNLDCKSYYVLEREGLSVPITSIVEDKVGRPIYSMRLFEKLDANDERVKLAKMFAEQKRKLEELDRRCKPGGDLYEEYMPGGAASSPSLFIDKYGNLVHGDKQTHKAIDRGVGAALRRLDAMRDTPPLLGPFSGAQSPAPFGALKS